MHLLSFALTNFLARFGFDLYASLGVVPRKWCIHGDGGPVSVYNFECFPGIGVTKVGFCCSIGVSVLVLCLSELLRILFVSVLALGYPLLARFLLHFGESLWLRVGSDGLTYHDTFGGARGVVEILTYI